MNRGLLLCALLFSSLMQGQAEIEDEKILMEVNNTAQEEVFIHFSSSLLFVGEYLYYKVYSLNAETGEFSKLSKTAYVELVGADGKPVFRHKINLDQGAGQGDFFIPTSLNSGNYKLLGYTHWMANKGVENFFQEDVVVINPYTNQQQGLSLENATDSLAELKTAGVATTSGTASNEWLQLETNAEKFGKRERVVLNLESLEGGNSKGNYSVSVRRIPPVLAPSDLTAKRFSELSKETVGEEIEASEKIYLPELRGELISGKILPKEEANTVSVTGKEVALSLAGENFLLKISETDEQGRFYFNLEDYNSEETAILQVLGQERESFEIELDEHPTVDYSSLDFGNFELTPDMERMIVQRSVHNQIENGYFGAKPDTIRLKEPRNPFYGEEMFMYDLDDYTRFETIKETFVEYIRFIRVKKDSIGDDILEIREFAGSAAIGRKPLLIVDGVMIQDHGDFINYPADRIQRIGVLRDKYFLGPMVFQGVVTAETINGNFNTARNKEHLHHIELLRPLPEKNYFRQKYSEADKKERIPDFRYQLLWLPDLVLDSETVEVEFFTSDNPGAYEISVEGFTNSGEPVSLQKVITVE